MAISGWRVFLIILVLVIIFGGGGYIFYIQFRARKLGLPPPSLNPFAKKRTDNSNYLAPTPAPSGPLGWITDKFNSLRGGDRGRTTTGGYEGYGAGGARNDRRGFGPLDPDEAWDARVGNEAGGYGYEEQELGLQDPSHGPYGGGGYGDVGVAGIEPGRGRSRSRQREVDNRYDEEVHGAGQQQQQGLNPFGDSAEASSMRGISPRPADQKRAPSAHKRGQSSLNTTGSLDDSPTERRSMFHEDV